MPSFTLFPQVKVNTHTPPVQASLLVQSELAEQRFPVFCRYRTPLDSLPRWRATEWGRPVTIGGVRVAPGDVVVGDLDGVAVVPKALAVPVLLECERLLSTENRVRAAVRKGMAPLAAYEKFGVF